MFKYHVCLTSLWISKIRNSLSYFLIIYPKKPIKDYGNIFWTKNQNTNT